MPTIATASQLIALAYQVTPAGQLVRGAPAPPLGWQIDYVSDHTSSGGDFSVTFYNTSAKEVFVAGRGTDVSGPTVNGIFGYNDAFVDASIALPNAIQPASRIDDAAANLQSVVGDTLAVGNSLYGYSVSAGGHSLDGFIYAQVGNEAQFANVPILAEDAPDYIFAVNSNRGNVLAIGQSADLVGNATSLVAYPYTVDISLSLIHI